MPAIVPHRGHFVIAEWTVEPELNAISRDGMTAHLEPKVMKVLLQLAMAPGQVLSKADLIEAVWPDTFVSDDVLTRCISVLRREMHDDPHAPRYIQTIPKAGYRMVAEVRYIEPQENHVVTIASDPPAATHDPPPAAGTETQIRVLTAAPETVQQSRRSPRQRRWPLLTAATAVVVLAAIGYAAWRMRVRQAQWAFNIIPLTSYTGQQDQRAFSPDGTRVAFVWSKPDDNGSRNLFIKRIGSETLLRLTDNLEESDFSPAWSPDGTKIAYFSLSDK